MLFWCRHNCPIPIQIRFFCDKISGTGYDSPNPIRPHEILTLATASATTFAHMKELQLRSFRKIIDRNRQKRWHSSLGFHDNVDRHVCSRPPQTFLRSYSASRNTWKTDLIGTLVSIINGSFISIIGGKKIATWIANNITPKIAISHHEWGEQWNVILGVHACDCYYMLCKSKC